MTSFWHRKSEPMWSKIASRTTPMGTSATFWVPSSLSLMYKHKHFQPHGGQRIVLMCSNAWHCDFIAHIVHHHNISHHPSIHPSMHRSIRPSIHPCTQSCMHRHVYTAAWCTLCDGWRVGLVHAKCHCNHIRDNRYRDQPLVTLPYLTLPYPTLPYLKLLHTIPYYYDYYYY